MSNIFDDALAEFTEAMTNENAVTISYKRGNIVQTITTAWIGETKKQSKDQTASKVEWWDRQYFIPKCDLTLEGEHVEPAEGDRITTCDGVVYELISHETEPFWEYLDYQNTIFQLRCKEIQVD